MTIQDLKKGWPLIVLGLIASMCLIRGCSIIMSPPMKVASLNEGIRHLVFLKLKEEVNKEEVISKIQNIKSIQGLKDLEIGLFKDLDDARAMSDYDLAFSMIFEEETDYQLYQDHPFHVELKNELKEFLAGPPVTYDFELE